VGSRAHGLHNENSDYDHRGVFIVPTSEILSLGYKEKATSWLEGQGEDATAYELHHFLHLACHSNPSILEVLVSPTIESTPVGDELKTLFPYLWNSVDVVNAFIGYGKNQQKKYLDDKDGRPGKFATAWVRILLLGIELLKYGTMTVNVEEQEKVIGRISPHIVTANISNGTVLGIIKGNVLFSKGQIVDLAAKLQKNLEKAYEENKDKKTDFDKVNAFLLKTRKENW
jgi:predicted nucleotidyltransferase